MRNLLTCLFISVLVSCNWLKQEKKVESNDNTLIVTADGDSLENGLWKYDASPNGVSATGKYLNGFKVEEWIYKSRLDSARINWNIFNSNGVEFNYPANLSVIKDAKMPLLFQADIKDGDNDTYLAILKYNLSEQNLTVYDYLKQLNHAVTSDSIESLISKEIKKFDFKKIEVFRARIESEKRFKYSTTSYIFVVNNYLYDLTYKNAKNKISAIDNEIISDILYSMTCDGHKLFGYNNKHYSKESDIIFE